MCIRNEKGVKLNEMCMFHSSSSNSYTTKLVYYFWWVIFNSNVNCYFIHYSPNHTQYTYRITHQTNAIIVSRNMILCCCCCFFYFSFSAFVSFFLACPFCASPSFVEHLPIRFHVQFDAFWVVLTIHRFIIVSIFNENDSSSGQWLLQVHKYCILALGGFNWRATLPFNVLPLALC